MWWGGLRGSVGLALALSIYHTTYDGVMWGEQGEAGVGSEMWLPCRDLPHGILMVTIAVIFFTVVVNGMSMRFVMSYLQLTKLSDERTFMLNRACLSPD